MIFIDGFVHADPHQGNLLIRKRGDDGDTEVILLDHGLYKTLDESTRLAYARLWRAIITQNEDEMCLAAKELSKGENYKVTLFCY
jgi:aarF domain-containing kinase